MQEKKISGILHCHSSYSYDAKLSLPELKTLFQKQGLSFVCMTEHTNGFIQEQTNRFVEECRALSDESFLFIPGFEVPAKRAHILMIGARAFKSIYAPSGKELGEWAREAKLVILAHPVRNNFEVDATLLSHIDALEVWNEQYEGKWAPRTRSLRLFAELKKKKPTLVATGGLDMHRTEHLGTPITTMCVSELTEDAIIQKLREGAYTVSSSRALIYGTLPNVEEIIKKYRWQSFFSVMIIVIGKLTNKFLATFGLKFPSWLKQKIRQRI